jgi:hypothetical protein
VRRIPTSLRRSFTLLLCGVVVLAAGCGGGGENVASEPAPAPTIDPAVADRLAAASDAVADALDAGDVCGAAGLADDLNAQVIAAVNAGEIPPRYQEDVQSRANELVNTVNCPQPADDDEDEDEPKKKEKKKKKEDNGDEDGEVPLPPPTVTETLPGDDG